ncbi:PREDICTED: uncharacterized protein LOC108783566 [Cyphomyrmex costatus]|uniref:uncharacterized protein LOC108783566 n=1 Tax=Cyphomyrmex costatus TaxID=456900 RepID=UPI00085242B2|nr:PREDICTED: uncharacterized protein LOC108783566 [Cyphomyrmex costatus]
MAKSEINILQELLVKQGSVPIYSFSEKKNDYQTQFICDVICKQMITSGTGRSKKEAKHNAARNMLSLLATNNLILLPVVTSSITNVPQNSAKVDYTPNKDESQNSAKVNYTPNEHVLQNPTTVYNTPNDQILQNSAKVFNTPNEHIPQNSVKVSDTPDEYFNNYIGMLQEFWKKQIPTQNLQYKLLYEDGLSHSKIFVIEVSLGSLCETGSANSKKTAKQNAAKKMLQRLNPDIIFNKNTHKIDMHDKKILKNKLEELNTKIIECANIKEDTSSEDKKRSEEATLLYLKSTQGINSGTNVHFRAAGTTYHESERDSEKKINDDVKIFPE